MIALGSLARQQCEHGERVSYIRAVAVRELVDQKVDPNRMVLPLIQAEQDSQEKFALTHYNRAIAELASRIGGSDVPIETVLLACVLFCCVEFLRGDVQPALKHFKAGMNVALASLDDKYPIGHLTVHRIEQNMLPFFNRLELLSTLLGSEADWDYNISLDKAVPKSFCTMRQARDSLVHIMNHGVRFIVSFSHNSKSVDFWTTARHLTVLHFGNLPRAANLREVL